MNAMPRSLPERLRQIWAATRLDLLRISRGRYRRARLALLGLPAIGAGLMALVLIQASDQPFSRILNDGGSSFGPEVTLTETVRWMWGLSLRFCVFLALIDVFGNLFRGELSERTLHHVFLQPLRREAVTVGKYFAGFLALLRPGAIAWLLMMVAILIPHGPGALFSTLFSGLGLKMFLSYVGALALAAAAYGGVFLLAGMVARGAVLIGAALWVWELLALFLPLAFQRFTISYWIASLRPVRMPPKFALAQEVDPAPVLVSVLVCLLVGAVTTAAAAWWSRHLQLSYGAKD